MMIVIPWNCSIVILSLYIYCIGVHSELIFILVYNGYGGISHMHPPLYGIRYGIYFPSLHNSIVPYLV